MRTNYGIIKEVTTVVAHDIVDALDGKKPSTLLRVGHDRWKLIDQFMMDRMGRNIKEYWEAQSIVYKSMLRRKIWEKVILLQKAKEKADTPKLKSPRRRPQSISLESLIESVSEIRT